MTSHSLCSINTTFKAGSHEYGATVLTDIQLPLLPYFSEQHKKRSKENMFCTCCTINNSIVPITHMELLTRQTYKTPEPLFVQQASVVCMAPFTYLTHSERQTF